MLTPNQCFVFQKVPGISLEKPLQDLFRLQARRKELLRRVVLSWYAAMQVGRKSLLGGDSLQKR